jgi:hypothetical protein
VHAVEPRGELGSERAESADRLFPSRQELRLDDGSRLLALAEPTGANCCELTTCEKPRNLGV